MEQKNNNRPKMGCGVFILVIVIAAFLIFMLVRG